MSAPPRVFYMDLNPKGVKGDITDLVLKSDYDELKAKLTEAERLNKVALEAMKCASGYYSSEPDVHTALKYAIKELGSQL